MEEEASKITRWVGISGTWALMNEEVERDVRAHVRRVFKEGGGIVTGGALGVDFFATDEAIKLDPQCGRIKIFLPSTLTIYVEHYRSRAREKGTRGKETKDLIAQLEYVVKANPEAIVENKTSKIVDRDAYFKRNTEVVKASGELLAFHVVESTGGGTRDTIKKAEALGIPIKRFDYKLKE